jgi:PAS domain S-box-containing protein
MFQRLSIPQKLIFLSTLASAAALLIASFIFLAYDHASYRTFLIDGLTTQADVVGSNSISAIVFDDPDSARQTISALQKNPIVKSASLFTIDGQFFAGWFRSPQFAIAQIPHESADVTTYEFHGNELLLSRKLFFDSKPVATLVVRADFSILNRRLKSFITIAFIILLVSVATAFLLSSLLQRTLMRAIVALSETARTISRDRNFSIRAQPTGTTDEIAVLVDAFNEMLSAIQARDFTLSSERARLHTILENAPIGILVVESPSGRIILSNRKFEEMMHGTIRDLGEVEQKYVIMRPDRTPVAPSDLPLTRAMQRVESVRGEENLVRRPDGTETWVRASAAPVLDENGKRIAAVLVLSELDDQKKAQEALLRSEKLAAAGRLAASISHEINNPLESVMNLLYISLSDPGLSSTTRAHLELADQELARVSHIATQTLRFYRQNSRPTTCNVGALIDSVLQLLAGKLRNVDVEVIRDFQSKDWLLCLEGELRQVFTNLLGNSLDAMAGPGGRLRVRTKTVTNRDGRRGIQVSVADSGHGIPPEVASHIFEPFYTTKGNLGTGLGLWVCRDIVAKHAGSIRVRSKKGVGTVFVVFLPLDGLSLPLSETARSA